MGAKNSISRKRQETDDTSAGRIASTEPETTSKPTSEGQEDYNHMYDKGIERDESGFLIRRLQVRILPGMLVPTSTYNKVLTKRRRKAPFWGPNLGTFQLN